jgi:hypothetical protein
MKGSLRLQDATAEEVDVGAAAHLALEHLDPVHVSLDRS